MTISYVKQDITEVTSGIIGHGVNCQVAMGSGIALALYTKWPKVKSDFIKANLYGPNALGTVKYVKVTSDGIVVANCYTQEYYGRNRGRRYGSPEAVEKCINKLVCRAHKTGSVLHLPRIGCGLAGLDWDIDVLPGLIAADNKLGNEVDIVIHDLK